MRRFTVDTIGFDGDDTLWACEELYQEAELRVRELLASFAPYDLIESRFAEIENKNIEIYGFGVKGFVLSLIEMAVSISSGRVCSNTINQVIQIGKNMLSHPLKLRPGAISILEELSQTYKLGLITRGDLLDQQSKINRADVSLFFSFIEIVTSKNKEIYRNICLRHELDPNSFVMVGNSVKSDILPVLELGACAIHIPAARTWRYDHTEVPDATQRWTQVRTLNEIRNCLVPAQA